MSNPYQLIVFDWEGTISDTLGLIINTVTSETRRLGFGDIDPKVARKYVDLGLVQALRKTLPNLSPKQHEELLQAIYFTINSRPSEVCLIPGAREFIQQIHDANIAVAVASNKGQHSLSRAIQASGLTNLISVVRSAGQTAAKPDPQMLEEIMEELGINESQTLMIGDSTVDMEMAKSIDVTAIGVDFYHQQESALKEAGAIAVFDDYQLVANYINLSAV